MPDDEALARELDAELNAGGRRTRHRPAYYGDQQGGGAGGGVDEEDEWRDEGEVRDVGRWCESSGVMGGITRESSGIRGANMREEASTGREISRPAAASNAAHS